MGEANAIALNTFRAKLWWNHLPSQQVRARGTKRAGEDDAELSCELCNAPGEGSTWHILSQCSHERLVAVRKRVGGELRAKHWRLLMMVM